jgi:tetratricopeptide (TPR) repeat protein
MDAEALYLENAFGRGPHVLTIFRGKESMIDIENILPDGFDYKGHLNDPSRTGWGDTELVADIYHSRGNEFYEKGDYTLALRSYDRAMSLNPLYERARLNRAIVLDRVGEAHL